LRLTGAARDDAGMPSVRTPALATLIAATVVLGSFAVLTGCRGSVEVPTAAPPDVHLAGASTGTAGSQPVCGRQDLAAPSNVQGPLEAVRTVAQYCDLIEAGQFARAGDLCAHRRLWSRRALGALSRFQFRSARVYAAPDARTLVLKARVRVHAERGRPLPDGLAVLFFTLGRAGSSVGGWLITAVSTSP
jgi:hypothetical protein